MAVTKTWDSSLAIKLEFARKFKPVERRRELFWLAGASLVVGCGLAMVLAAKTQDFQELEERLARGELLDLNQVSAPQQLLPVLQTVAVPGEQESIAERVWSYLEQHRPLPNVGALAHLHLLPLAKVKPLLVVRRPGKFLHESARSVLLYIAAFWIVHFAWRLRRFRGDRAIFPALHC